MARGERHAGRPVDREVDRVDRIVVGYLVAAGLWIVGSGPLASWVARTVEVDQTLLEMGKGLLFVLATAAVLRVALRRWARRVSTAGARERRAADVVRDADEQRTAFLQGVSHELRTPLTSVLGYAQTIQRLVASGAPTADVAPMTDRLVANAERLERLVVDLLESNALLRDQTTAALRAVDVSELVHRAVAEVDLGGRSIELVGDPLVVDLDAPKIERVLTTLLGNAVRHTPPTTGIAVAWTERAGQLLLIVEDDGPGFPEEVGQRVFEAFVQGRTASADAQPGVGIGLSLVAQYVRLHGGRILAANRARGGARIEIRIPLDPDRPLPAEPRRLETR